MNQTIETTPFGRRIAKERKRRGWSLRQAAEEMGISYSRLNRVENEGADVNMQDAAKIAYGLGVPLSSLVNGPAVRDRVVAAARTRDEDGMEDAIDAVMPALELAAQLDRINFEVPDRELPQGYDRDSETPSQWGQRVAAEVRLNWGIRSGPIKDLAALIESRTGAMVMVAGLPDDVDGLTLVDPETQHAVLAARLTPHWERQRFTLAHELGHYLAGDKVIEAVGEAGGSPTETAASEFARNFLVPRTDLAQLHGQPGHVWDDLTIAKTAWEYQVSPKVVAIQLDRENLINPTQVDRVAALSADTWSAVGGWAPERASLAAAAETRRVPPALANRAIQAWRSDLLAVSALARLLDRKPSDVAAELALVHAKPEGGDGGTGV